jgi:hypothetical protein
MNEMNEECFFGMFMEHNPKSSGTWWGASKTNKIFRKPLLG